MKINRNISKVLAATVAAGVVSVGVLGAGSASADGPNAIMPNIPVPPVVQPVPFNPAWNVRYNQPHLVNGRWVYPYQNYVNTVPYLNRYVAPYVYPVFAPATITASQFSFISAAATVMGMNRADVVIQLQQGQTLTGIAANRGMPRVALYNAVMGVMKGSINAAVGTGAISPATGNALLGNLNNRAGAVIDQPGTASGTNAGAIETAYQLF